jgi:hypothetical protein
MVMESSAVLRCRLGVDDHSLHPRAMQQDRELNVLPAQAHGSMSPRWLGWGSLFDLGITDMIGLTRR